MLQSRGICNWKPYNKKLVRCWDGTKCMRAVIRRNHSFPLKCKTAHFFLSHWIEFVITGYYDTGRLRVAGSQGAYQPDLSCHVSISTLCCVMWSQRYRQTDRRTDVTLVAWARHAESGEVRFGYSTTHAHHAVWRLCRYWQGVLRPRSDRMHDGGLQRIVDGAAAWMDKTVSVCDADVVEDWEVDELLHWSTGLDFDHYWNDWQSIATSDLSEAAVRESNVALRSRFLTAPAYKFRAAFYMLLWGWCLAEVPREQFPRSILVTSSRGWCPQQVGLVESEERQHTPQQTAGRPVR